MADEHKAKRLEIAHVLFMDIVGYSKLLTDEQSEALQERKRPGSGKMKAAFQGVGLEKKGSCFHELRRSRYPQEVQRAVRAG